MSFQISFEEQSRLFLIIFADSEENDLQLKRNSLTYLRQRCMKPQQMLFAKDEPVK